MKDTNSWISNSGEEYFPECLEMGELVDVIHRDGALALGVEAGESYAEDFSINVDAPVEGDIRFYRRSVETIPVFIESGGIEILENM